MDRVQELVKTFASRKLQCVNPNVYDITGQIYEKLRHKSHLCEASKQLLCILSQPHVRALLDVHDRVANHEFLPQLPDIVSQVDEEDTVVKVLKLYKHNEPLGVTIKRRENDGIIYIARVFVGGPADRSGMVQAGDEMHEVNGIPCKGRNIEQIVNILSTCEGAISLKLVPAHAAADSPNVKKRIKVHVTYDPNADLLIPCKDAGLGFTSGDILEVLNTDDKIWWQARHYKDLSHRTGLIPSKALQERRANESFQSSLEKYAPNTPSLQRKARLATQLSSANTGSLLSPRITKKLKKSKKLLRQAHISEAGFVEFLYTNQEAESPNQDLYLFSVYEEVALYRPTYGYRPIVLIGPEGVGKADLMLKLLKDNLVSYRLPLTCTSRSKKMMETDGKEYCFLSRADMELNIQQQRFLEYGEHKGHLYGVRISDIKAAISSGKVCVLTCQPQVLHILRQSDIKPYVIFIKSAKLEKLKSLKLYTGEKTTRKLTANEIEGIVLASARIEAVYGHLVDESIVNLDFYQTYRQLVCICHNVETEEKWIPVDWLRH